MNPLYPLVEEAFRAPSPHSLARLQAQLAALPGDPSDAFALPANWEYVVKRLLGALLARDPDLKFNAFLVLSALSAGLAHVRVDALFEHIVLVSDFKKHCEGKASEVEAYAIGKILTFRALRSVFAGHLNAVSHVAALLPAFPALEEQIVELVAQLATDKKTTLVFLKLAPNTKAGFVLQALLRAQLKAAVPDLNANVVVDVLLELVATYPRRSICLDYLGPQLKRFLPSPAKFLSEQLAGIFESEGEVQFRALLYVLQLVGGHLRGVTVTAENVWEVLSLQMLGAWILQLKVKNKHVRKMAEGITVEFQGDPALAFEVLSQLHQNSLYLENINHKHPLYPLYHHVDAHAYAHYLLQLTQQPQQAHFNELEVFLVARHKDLTVEEVCQIITVFVNRHHQAQSEPALQALNTIFNALLAAPKKAHGLHTRASLILAKLNFDQLELGEQQQEVRQAAKAIRARFKGKDKEGKEESDPFTVAYHNFLLAAGFYFLIFPEDVEVFADLEVVERELQANVLNSESGQAKKKRKGEDRNKPVHVLVEALISLLTKASHFLRAAVNLTFEHLVPYLDASDIAALLDVATKPEAALLADQPDQ